MFPFQILTSVCSRGNVSTELASTHKAVFDVDVLLITNSIHQAGFAKVIFYHTSVVFLHDGANDLIQLCSI